jgi:L-malate glycosyltransferase
VETLLMAHGLLKRRGVELRLQLIGGGYGPGGPCEVWARGRGLAEGVAFVGSLDRAEVLRRLRSASVLVHPAREESFGMTLIEAMSQHVPVIAGASSGAVPWVLDDGNAGLLVDVNDPRALGGALEAVLTQTTLQSKLAAAGYARAWGQFRQSHVTDLYVDLYRRVLAEVRCD